MRALQGAAIRMPSANPTDDLLEEPEEDLLCAVDSRSPTIEVVIGHSTFLGLVDTGSEVSCISFETFQQIETLLPGLVSFPVEGVRVTGAFKGKSRKVSQQVLLEFGLGGGKFEFEFLVIPDLGYYVILGADFMRAFHV